MIKTDIFSQELQELSRFTKAIAHPARLAILQYLAETKTCISGDISKSLPLSRSTVSQHLKELKDLGLIQGRIDGLKTNYCLCSSNIDKYLLMFESFFEPIKAVDISCETLNSNKLPSMKNKNLKGIVKEKYGAIAGQNTLLKEQGCCGPSNCCGELEFSMIGDEYTEIDGHNADADLGLGCGLPTEFAQIKKGDTVIDLGAGAGNDCFVARTLVGETGKVIGLDFTEEMVQKAQQNLTKTGFKNIEFIQGDIEEMPLPDSTCDVVISNCVLNLVPDKQKAFSEIFRILKQGGHFSISDVVTSGALPEGLKEAAEMYAGCVSGAIDKQEYLKIIEDEGFSQIKIQKEKPIVIPDETLQNYLNEEELTEYKRSGRGIFSITVYAEKNSRK